MALEPKTRSRLLGVAEVGVAAASFPLMMRAFFGAAWGGFPEYPTVAFALGALLALAGALTAALRTAGTLVALTASAFCFAISVFAVALDPLIGFGALLLSGTQVAATRFAWRIQETDVSIAPED